MEDSSQGEPVEGWLPDPQKPCNHANRPRPGLRDAGRRWKCACGAVFAVEIVDYGHDVQQGERSTDAVWREQFPPIPDVSRRA